MAIYHSIIFHFQHSFWQGMDYLFPPFCAGCGHFSYRFCPACYQDVKLFSQSNPCLKCGNQMTGRFCKYCETNHFVIQSIKSWGIYRTSLRQAILRLKFYGDLGLGDEFVPKLKKVIEESKWQVDLVAPVPLSPQRMRERGFNQAAVLAIPLAFSLNVPYLPHAIIKYKEIRSQIGLSFDERMVNILDTFQASSRIVKGKSILVVDDVTTTGATLNSCAQAMLNAGAAAVFGVTLAKTIFNLHAEKDIFLSKNDKPDRQK